ncbi:tetratricopeptide repeat protein, partial [Aeromonas caviae]|uniref:tetratricopeptide repeat protein n=1 Tax=Aeromonas caviae TaxID=648 RepID=UPI001CC4AE8F
GQDEHKAVTWYRAAAEQGFAAAQFHLGVMYTKGQGVAKDYSQAVAWSRLAAEQGHVQAQYFLGWMYTNGL